MKHVYINTGQGIEHTTFGGHPKAAEIAAVINRDFPGHAGFAICEAAVPFDRYTERLEVSEGNVSAVPLQGESLLEGIEAKKLVALAAHDQSPEVNRFALNGKTLWLDAATRAKFRMAMEAARALNQNTIELVLPEAGIDVQVPVSAGLDFLNRLELYAAGCAIATKKHQMAINALTTPEALAAYDFKTNYPEKLTLTL